MTKKIAPCPYDGKDVAPKHRLVKLFWVLGPAFTRWADAHMDQKGLTPQRVRLMVFLLENGPSAMGSLKNELGVTATNITALVDALEKDGMVKRKPHPKDRRSTIISLTTKGQKRMTENCLEFTDRVSQLFSIFNKSEQQQFIQLLDRMRESLGQKRILRK